MALGQPETLGSELGTLIAKTEEQPETFATDRTFDGTLHFIRQEETLAPAIRDSPSVSPSLLRLGVRRAVRRFGVRPAGV